MHATSHAGVVVVDLLLLNEVACHQPRLVLDHHAQLVLLELEHPLQGDSAVAIRQWY